MNVMSSWIFITKKSNDEFFKFLIDLSEKNIINYWLASQINNSNCVSLIKNIFHVDGMKKF